MRRGSGGPRRPAGSDPATVTLHFDGFSSAARALEFAILTAARTGEVIGARWGEVNLAERLWTVPGERMKARQEHVVAFEGTLYLEDGVHRALRAALQQRTTIHARVHIV